MTRLTRACVMAVLAYAVTATLLAQTVYPTGTTIFDPDRTWSGFTVLSPLATPAVPVIDMNGTVVKQWDGFNNSAGGPARVLPGGYVIAASGARPPNQESLELVERDFDGKVLWSFSRNQEVTTADGQKVWAARQHHDWQREDFPAGYYSPASNPNPQNNDRTLLLTHVTQLKPAVADVTIEDDRLIEVSRNGEVLWEWVASDHIDEFNFSADARKVIKSGPASNGPAGAAGRATFDWLHVNSAHYVGPNHWFDAGDMRFAPTNVIISSREASLLAIIGRDGHIVWQLGPDYSASKELRAIRQVIGQHHAHFIPTGLPGAGNLLIFDNGGASGYGFFSPIGPDGRGALTRPTSRVLEINPVTLELVWSYTNPRFFASNISGAQRLPNGNTLITSGPTGRVFEVTKEGTIVWEYIWPSFSGANNQNSVYRAYRIPYSWIPQLATPRERKVTPPAPGDFHVGRLTNLLPRS
jgi:hypothetical protein